MNKNKKSYILYSALAGSMLLASGCTNLNNELTVKDVIYSVVSEEEAVKIDELVVKDESTEKSSKDLKLILNLDKYSKSIIYEKSMEVVTEILHNIDFALDSPFDNFKILVNSSENDIYGNKQKVKVLEIDIDKATFDKINFENFDFMNLDKLVSVKKFKYLTEK